MIAGNFGGRYSAGPSGLRADGSDGRGRRAARLGVDYVTTATGVVLVQAVLASWLARLRGGATRGVAVSMAGTALLSVSQYLAAATADEPELPTLVEPGHPPPFRSADGVIFELETLDAEPWRLLWTGLGARNGGGPGVAAVHVAYTTAVASLPATLHAATEARPFAELARAAAAAGVAVQRLRRHDEGDRICGCTPLAAPWTVEWLGPAMPGSAACGSAESPLAASASSEYRCLRWAATSC